MTDRRGKPAARPAAEQEPGVRLRVPAPGPAAPFLAVTAAVFLAGLGLVLGLAAVAPSHPLVGLALVLLGALVLFAAPLAGVEAAAASLDRYPWLDGTIEVTLSLRTDLGEASRGREPRGRPTPGREPVRR
jgi:hypothetical protein